MRAVAVAEGGEAVARYHLAAERPKDAIVFGDARLQLRGLLRSRDTGLGVVFGLRLVLHFHRDLGRVRFRQRQAILRHGVVGLLVGLALELTHQFVEQWTILPVTRLLQIRHAGGEPEKRGRGNQYQNPHIPIVNHGVHEA